MKVFLPIAALLAAGCLAPASTDDAALAPAITDGLVVLSASSSNTTEITGELGLPARGATALPGSYDDQEFELPDGALFVAVNLTWATKGPTVETSDLDLLVYGGDGRLLATAASEADVEATKFRVTPKVVSPILFRTINFSNPPTAYTLTVEVIS